MKPLRFLFLLVIVANSGCLARQLARDGKSAHEAIADCYTEQALTNLIRARNNLPFVQLKYSALNISDQDLYTSSLGSRQTVTTRRSLFALAASRTLDNLTSLGATASRTRSIQVSADPIITQNDIYERYLSFANDPQLFIVSDKPPSGAAHLVREFEHSYYWIPCEAAPCFLDLVLYTSQMRGPDPASVVSTPYEVKILQVVAYELISKRDIANAVLVLDKPVPNGQGTIVVDLEGGRKVPFAVWPISKDEKGKDVPLGDPTTRIEVQWAPKKHGFLADQLVRRPARIYSNDYPQDAPAPDPIIRQIADDINQIRINVQLGNIQLGNR